MAKYDFVRFEMNMDLFNTLLSAIDLDTEGYKHMLKHKDKYNEEQINNINVEIMRNETMKENLIHHCQKYIEENQTMSIFENELVSLFVILLYSFRDLIFYKEWYDKFRKLCVEQTDLIEKQQKTIQFYADIFNTIMEVK